MFLIVAHSVVRVVADNIADGVARRADTAHQLLDAVARANHSLHVSLPSASAPPSSPYAKSCLFCMLMCVVTPNRPLQRY
jgi:hypothetical protein